MQKLSRVQECALFIDDHETIIRTALRVYIERMTEAAEEAERSVKHAEVCPLALAELERPGSIMTLSGLHQSAAIFRDCVRRADETWNALLDLTEMEY